MKMIWAIIQSESCPMVIDALEKAGIRAMTRMDVTGYNKDPGIPAVSIGYTEMPKEMLMIGVADNDVARAVIAIRTAAKTWLKEVSDVKNPINGKIFVTYVEDFYTIRIAQKTPEQY
jgi:nitrogen regulatory protein PII